MAQQIYPRKFRLTKTAEKELRNKLTKTLLSIVGLIVFMFLTLAFFAPKLGVFFGFFSKHRNEVDPTTIIRPNPPIFSSIPSANKDESININGYAQPGLTVVLYVNGPEISKTTVGADGLFTFGGVPLMQGVNTLSAKVFDQQAVASDSSTAFTIIVDKDKPKITVDSPKNGSTVQNLDKRIKIIGKINEKASIKINDRMAIQRPDLSFEFLLGVLEGNVEIKIEATDEAGNVGIEKLNVNYSKDSQN